MNDRTYTLEEIKNGWLVTTEKSLIPSDEDDRAQYFDNRPAAVQYIIDLLQEELKEQNLI